MNGELTRSELPENIGKINTVSDSDNDISNKESNDYETVLKEDYKFEGGNVVMVLSKDDKGKYRFSITIVSDIEWKAAYAYMIYSSVVNMEEMQAFSPTITMMCGDTIVSNIASWTANDKGEVEIVKGNEWCAKVILDAQYTDEEYENFSDEIQKFITDFMSK